ncbi:hypothetical protein LSO9J_200015 [Candidatus Liberibacter solanacearum]
MYSRGNLASLHFILNQLPKDSGEEKGLPGEEVKKVSPSTPTASNLRIAMIANVSNYFLLNIMFIPQIQSMIRIFY